MTVLVMCFLCYQCNKGSFSLLRLKKASKIPKSPHGDSLSLFAELLEVKNIMSMLRIDCKRGLWTWDAWVLRKTGGGNTSDSWFGQFDLYLREWICGKSFRQPSWNCITMEPVERVRLPVSVILFKSSSNSCQTMRVCVLNDAIVRHNELLSCAYLLSIYWPAGLCWFWHD